MEATDTLRTFFVHMWGDTEGLVYLPTRSRTNEWRKNFFQWPQKTDDVVQHVIENTAASREVYFAPALYGPEVLAGKKPNKYSAIGVRTLWADFDGSDNTPAPSEWEKLSDIIQEPSLRVQTSSPSNQHCYWLLDHLETDLQWVEDKNRAIAYTVNSDKGCWNADRLLRPPESINFGYSKPERKGKQYPVELAEVSDRLNPSTAFNHLKSIKLLVEQAIVLSDTPPIEDVMMGCKWSEHMIKLFKAAGETTPSDRSGALVSLAMQAAEMGWKDGEIYSLVKAADTRWGKYVDRTDREIQLTSIVERARRKHPVGAENLSFAGLIGSTAVDKDVELNPKIAYKHGEFRRLEIKIDWHFENLLSVGGYGFFFGAPGTGKTQLALQMARAAACGDDFLEWKNLSGPQKVYVFSLEMAATPLKYFTDLQDQHYNARQMALMDENLIMAPIGESIPIAREEGRKFFESQIEEHRPSIIMIDSLGSFTMGSLTEDTPNREMSAYLQRIRRKYGISIYVVHHSNKSRPTPVLEQSDLYGSVYIYTGADFVLGIGVVDKSAGILQVNMVKNRLAAMSDPTIISRGPFLTYSTWKEPDVVRRATGRGGSSETLADLLRTSKDNRRGYRD